jgi:hypothetical protein
LEISFWNKKVIGSMINENQRVNCHSEHTAVKPMSASMIDISGGMAYHEKKATINDSQL